MWFEVDKSVFLAGIFTYLRSDTPELELGSFRILTDGDKVFIYSEDRETNFQIGYWDHEMRPEVFKIGISERNGSYILLHPRLSTEIPLKPCIFPKSNSWMKDLPSECYGAHLLGADGSAHEVVNNDGVPSIRISRGTQFLPINECHLAVRIAFYRKYSMLTKQEIV